MANYGNIAQSMLNGFMQGSKWRESRDASAEDKAWREEQRAALRTEAAEKKSLRADLTNAARPVEMVEGAGGAVLPPTMDNRDVGESGEAPLAAQGAYRVGAKTYQEPAQAQAAVTAENEPTAVLGRQAQVYASRGMPEKALPLQDQQMQLQKYGAELKEKGVLDGLRDFRRGDSDGAIKGLKASGLYQPDGDVTIEPRDMELPGYGKLKTYDLKFNNKVGDKLVPTVVNSHEASMAVMPYEKALEMGRKGVKDEAVADNQAAKLGIAEKRLELQGEINAARIAKLQSGGGGGGGGGGAKNDREYRILLQQQTSNIGKEVRELDALIKHAEENSTKTKPDPQLAGLRAERSQLAARRNALNDEFTNLAEKKSPGNENIAQSRALKVKETPRGKMVQVKNEADYARLPSGTMYIAPDGTEKRKK